MVIGFSRELSMIGGLPIKKLLMMGLPTMGGMDFKMDL